MLEAMPAVTPDTRSKGNVTADTALRLRLDITPGVATTSLSRLHYLSFGHCCSSAEGLTCQYQVFRKQTPGMAPVCRANMHCA